MRPATGFLGGAACTLEDKVRSVAMIGAEIASSSPRQGWASLLRATLPHCSPGARGFAPSPSVRPAARRGRLSLRKRSPAPTRRGTRDEDQCTDQASVELPGTWRPSGASPSPTHTRSARRRAKSSGCGPASRAVTSNAGSSASSSTRRWRSAATRPRFASSRSKVTGPRRGGRGRGDERRPLQARGL